MDIVFTSDSSSSVPSSSESEYIRGATGAFLSESADDDDERLDDEDDDDLKTFIVYVPILI